MSSIVRGLSEERKQARTIVACAERNCSRILLKIKSEGLSQLNWDQL